MKFERIARSSWFDRLVRSRVDESLDRLDQGLAEFLNWAAGHRGYLAQAGLWFQPSLYVEHRVRGAGIHHVNERIVEVAFAFKALSDVLPGARVLDVGSAESTLALSLASLGYKAVALDPRGYPVAHPNLETVAQDVLRWEGPLEPFEAIFCISTLEHIGVGSYEQDVVESGDADRNVLDRCREWIRQDGILILTVPWGLRGEDDFQRTYDDDRLDSLLVDWDVIERLVVVRESPIVWRPLEQGKGEGASGVAMIKAIPRRDHATTLPQ